MSKLKYKLIGGNLPELFAGRQEPLLHYDGCWFLAEGEGWLARIVSRGEVRAYLKGERVRACEIPDYYATDKELEQAEKSGEFVVENNNWYEVEVLADRGDDGYKYLDIMSDDTVCFSFDEAIQIFNDYVNDEKWCEELMKAVKGE